MPTVLQLSRLIVAVWLGLSLIAPVHAGTHTSTESVQVSVTILQQLSVTSHSDAVDTGESTTALFPLASGSVQTAVTASRPDQQCLVHVHETSATSEDVKAQETVSVQQPYVLSTTPASEHLDAIHIETTTSPECDRGPLIVIISAVP